MQIFEQKICLNTLSNPKNINFWHFMAKYLKKIDFTDQSVNPEFNLSTAHLKVDLTKNPILPYEQQFVAKNFLC